ncbi:MAG: hypothetical protein R6X33_13165, partial [Candidatus Brocadiia bacterium]
WQVSNSEMRIFCQDQGPFRRIAEWDARQGARRARAMDGPSQIKRLRGGVLKYAAQATSQIDAEIGKKTISGWKLMHFITALMALPRGFIDTRGPPISKQPLAEYVKNGYPFLTSALRRTHQALQELLNYIEDVPIQGEKP